MRFPKLTTAILIATMLSAGCDREPQPEQKQPLPAPVEMKIVKKEQFLSNPPGFGELTVTYYALLLEDSTGKQRAFSVEGGRCPQIVLAQVGDRINATIVNNQLVNVELILPDGASPPDTPKTAKQSATSDKP